MLVLVGKDKDVKGRDQLIYFDTDDLSDEDYAEYCRLMREGDIWKAKALLSERVEGY